MAINQIPGVGPTNSDIAATIATTPAISSQIATAVAANAASVGVTMAAITSSITANAASAGVTLAAIASTGNSNNWNAGSITWTQIGYSTNTATSYTYSSISGYKYLKLVVGPVVWNTSTIFQVRFNGDTNSNYSQFAIGFRDGTTMKTNSPYTATYYNGQPENNQTQSSQTSMWTITISNVNNTINQKLIESFSHYYESSARTVADGRGLWNSGGAALTSVTVTNSAATSFVWQGTNGISLWGGN